MGPSPCNPDPADPSLCRVFLPVVWIQERFLVWISCELMGPPGAQGCSPAPAVGRHLLLYFAQAPARPDEVRLAAAKASSRLSPIKRR